MFYFSLITLDNALNCRILRDWKRLRLATIKRSRRGEVKRGARAIGSTGHSGDDDERLRERRFVGERQVDPRAHAARRDGLELRERAAGQDQGRPTRGEIDDAEVTPIDAAAKAGAQRLRASFLRGVALGIAGGAVGAAVGALALERREHPIEEAVAEALDGAFDAADVEDHGSLTRCAGLARRRGPDPWPRACA